jgi:hypothetical protein
MKRAPHTRGNPGYTATTYGRRTGSLHLQPFPFSELRGFLAG